MTLYLATGDGPVMITRHGDRWRAARPLDVRFATCIATNPRQPQQVFCTTAHDGVWRSDDAGANWRQVFQDVPHDRVTAVAVNGLGVVYVGTEPSAVFRSDDGGETWHACKGLIDLPSSGTWRFPPRPQTHHVRWIESDLHAPGGLYVAIEAGALVRSPDGGTTWQDRVPGGPVDTHQLAVHPAAPNRLWSAAGDGFFESSDAGATWRKAEQGLKHRYCWSVAVNPHDADVVVLSAANGPRQAHDADQAEAHLYRRTKDGESWQKISDGLPKPRGTRAYALAADPTKPDVFYAGTAGSLYRSADAGASWEQLPVAWPTGYTGTRIHVVTAVEMG